MMMTDRAEHGPERYCEYCLGVIGHDPSCPVAKSTPGPCRECSAPYPYHGQACPLKALAAELASGLAMALALDATIEAMKKEKR